MGSKLIAYFKLARIEHSLVCILGTLAGIAAALESIHMALSLNPLQLLAALLVPFFAEIALFVFNDYFNIEEDRINAPHRPLVTGEVSPREAIALGVAALVLAIGLSLYLALTLGLYTQFIILAFFLFIGMLYNLGVKKFGPVGNVIVAATSSAPLIYGFSIVTNDIFAMSRQAVVAWCFYLIAFFAMWGREVLKDILDVEGDSRVGCRTVPLIFGEEVARAVSAILFAVAIALSMVPPLYNPRLNKLVYVPIILFVDVMYAMALLNVLRGGRDQLESARKTTLVGGALAVIAFMFSYV